MTISNEFIAANARALLRAVLAKLHTDGSIDRDYETNVHRAMSLAHDAGFITTLHAAAGNDGGAAVFAVIELPTGRIAFELDSGTGIPSLPPVADQARYAFDFCSMVEGGYDTPVDSYNGHCRDCYAFKGRWGGECVLPECRCHGVRVGED